MSMPERRYVPEVRRPRGPSWRTLQADGLIWECQVFLVGAEVDLAALLIVTRNRFALARGGSVVLETDRAWLRPAPRLLPDGNVLINVAPPATADGQPEGHTLLLRMREGWRDASHLESLLTGGRGRSALGRRGPATP
ncbi:MAG: hypothetical protein H0U40_02180, partial [Chloroflexia bacterium]|nr:hypothetical protein [Chloroflexia bacterium]